MVERFILFYVGRIHPIVNRPSASSPSLISASRGGCLLYTSDDADE